MLNIEQDRIFWIVANHAHSPDSDPLKMNIAGMAGTGKTQVLKALVKFFELKNESHCLIIGKVQPTTLYLASIVKEVPHPTFSWHRSSPD